MSMILVVFALSRGCFSAPISSNSTSPSVTVPWQSQPDVRGTFQLVASCLITSTLCIWTSLHLNITKPNESKAHRSMRKLGLTIMALIAPELVVYMAFRQWSSAKALCDEVNHMLDVEFDGAKERKEPTAIPNVAQVNHRWTMVHGYYATMGGFVLEIDPTTESFIPAMSNRKSPLHLTVTARGVLLLAKCGHIPHIPEEFIMANSNPDSLAKTLICFQAAWIVLQVIARLAAHLPITLLEINTLNHVLSALAIYLCWWSKPLDILVPTVLSGKWVPRICAYMWMSSQISGDAPASHPTKPELRSLQYHPAEEIEGADGEDWGSMLSEARPSAHEISVSNVRLARGQTLANTGFELDLQSRYPNPPSHVDLRPVDVRRWELASEALRLIPAVRDNFRRFSEEIRSAGDELLVERTPNWHAWDLVEMEKMSFGLDIAIVLTVGSVAFGGLQAAAWNGFFPTGIERWMWRISSIYVISSCFILSALISVNHAIQVRHWSHGLFFNIFRTVLMLLFFLLALGYFPCKLFFVVEAFVSIRELPLNAYKTPDWTQLIPHF